MSCTWPVTLLATSDRSEMRVPCGSCPGCLWDRKRTWTNRLIHESKSHSDNSFVTFTYSDEFLPADGSLDPVQFQRFLKRFRKEISPIKVKYYVCGEYGSKTLRPHYHAIFFGFSFPDKLRHNHLQSPATFTSDLLHSCWPFGQCLIGEVNASTCAYVAGYVVKKSGDSNRIKFLNLHPEFSRMSRRPGLGASWFDSFHRDIFNVSSSDDINSGSIPDSFLMDSNGRKSVIPRYYRDRYRKLFSDEFAIFRDSRIISNKSLKDLENKGIIIQSRNDLFFNRSL